MDNNTTTPAPTATTAPAATAPAAQAAAPVAAPATTTAAPAQAQAAAHEGGEASHEGVTYNPKQPEPQIINGIKVFPTSYIPAKAELHTPKKALVEFEGEHIEIIHVAIFIFLTVALFIGMWKRPNLR